jgi:hypothetical protein
LKNLSIFYASISVAYSVICESTDIASSSSLRSFITTATDTTGNTCLERLDPERGVSFLTNKEEAKEEDQTEEDNAEEDNAEEDNAEEDNAEEDETEEDETEEDETEEDTFVSLQITQSYFRFPCVHPLQIEQFFLSFPCSQSLQIIQFCFIFPCVHPLQIEQ